MADEYEEYHIVHDSILDRAKDLWSQQGVLAGAAVLVAALLLFVLVVQPFSSTAIPTQTGAPEIPGGRGVAASNYASGSCVVWGQGKNTNDTTTEAVPCTSPHYDEIAAKLVLTDYPLGAAYPSADDWIQLVQTHCGSPDASYLGARVDPAGKFAVGGLYALPNDWTKGKRTLFCTIVTQGEAQSGAGVYALSSGSAKGQNQEVIPVVGSCFVAGSAGAKGYYEVSCDHVHDYEVTGSVTLQASVTSLPAPSAWQGLVNSGCSSSATGYLGATPGAGIYVGWLPIPASSWDAGQRTVACITGRSDSVGHIQWKGSMEYSLAS